MSELPGPRDPDAARPLPDIAFEPVELPGADSGAAPPPATRRAAASAPSVPTRVELASPDVVLPSDSAAVPGAHRGGFTRPPTAPLDVLELHPAEPDPPGWAPETPAPVLAPVPGSIGVGGYALAFACFGLVASLFVGWTFPIGVIALALGVTAVRRGVQRPVAAWAIALAATSLAYSAGWLLFAAGQAGWIG